MGGLQIKNGVRMEAEAFTAFLFVSQYFLGIIFTLRSLELKVGGAGSIILFLLLDFLFALFFLGEF